MAINGTTNTTDIVNAINSNLPEDLKLKGAGKIGQLISDQGVKVSTLMLPLALDFANKLGIDPNSTSLPDVCPSPDTLNTVLPSLNNLIDDLNQTGILITDLTKIIGSVSLGGQLLQTTSETLNTLLPSLTAAIAVIPPPGLPGAVVGAVDTVDFINKKILFKKDGTPQIPPILSSVNSATLSLVVTSGFILILTTLLEKIVTLLKQCYPDININNVNSNILSLAESAKPKTSENKLDGYKGFNLEIVEIPYNDSLIQRKAVARNQSGEIVLQTELSFTTDNNVLVLELKNLIDQSGLIGNVISTPNPESVPQSVLNGDIPPSIAKETILNNRLEQASTKIQNLLKPGVFSDLNETYFDFYVPLPKFNPITLKNVGANTINLENFIKQVNTRLSQLQYRDQQQYETNVSNGDEDYYQRDPNLPNKIRKYSNSIATLQSYIKEANNYVIDLLVFKNQVQKVEIGGSSILLPKLNSNPT